MRAWLRLNPRWFRWHCHRLICHLKHRLYLRLSNEEHDIKLIKLFLHNSRHIFEFFKRFLTQTSREELVLQSRCCYLLQDTTRSLFEVDSMHLSKQFQNNLVFLQLQIDPKILDILTSDFFNLDMLHFQHLVDNLKILWDVLDDSMLWMDHNIIAGVNDGLNPKILLLALIIHHIILMSSL